MSMVDGVNRGSYSDTPTPRVFGTVSSLDPQLFASVDEAVESLLEASPRARSRPSRSPGSSTSGRSPPPPTWPGPRPRSPTAADPRYRRVAIDCAIAAGIGRFFARKLRAGVLFGIFDRTGDLRARDEALDQYREARRAWADFATGAAAVYVRRHHLRLRLSPAGPLAGRLPAIDRDIAAMEARAATRSAAGGVDAGDARARGRGRARRRVPRRRSRLEHTPPGRLPPGRGRPSRCRSASRSGADAVRLFHRPLNQAEGWRQLERRRETASGGAPRCPPTTRARPIRSSTTSRCARPRASRCGPASPQTSPDSRTGSSGGCA